MGIRAQGLVAERRRKWWTPLRVRGRQAGGQDRPEPGFAPSHAQRDL